MDANRTRFHLLLGPTDWGRCTQDGAPLAGLWQSSPPGTTRADTAWDAATQELTLRPRLFLFVPAPSDVAPAADARRGAAADRFGNLYWIDPDRQRIRVRSEGTGTAEDFWPGPQRPEPVQHGDFADTAATPAQPWQLSGLAVTEDHYLVAGALAPACGLLLFDLFAGGAPTEMLWPAAVPFEPFDLAPRPGGGVWVLDRANRRYWALDRRFRVIADEQPRTVLQAARADTFQPVAAEPLRGMAERDFPEGLSVDAASPVEAVDAFGIEALADGTVLILDRGHGERFSRVLRYRFGQRIGEPVSLASMAAQIEEGENAAFTLVAHDFALVPAGDGEGEQVIVASADGNQAFAFALSRDGAGWGLQPLARYLPMRRFGGMALLQSGRSVHYDFSDSWVPLAAQPRPRFTSRAQIDTRADGFDGAEPDCVWHRLMLDACIPSETAVEILGRAANTREELEVAQWLPQPLPYRRGDSSELPWLPRRNARARGNSTQAGYGTWELLFQSLEGRYLQLRLILTGNERATPRLRALRTWYPRFSYSKQYLPAVYREEPDSASFLERFLANMEGMLTALEDKIAQVRALFHWDSAPAETLQWLAGWMEVILDPAWDERRRRLFIKHAMRFFQYRGTIHGVRMALALADPNTCEAELGLPGAIPESRQRFRVVERFRTRRTPGLVLGEPLRDTGPREVEVAVNWTPAEGGGRLTQRYREYLGTVDAADASAQFGLVPPPLADEEDRTPERWAAFAQSTLGFVPAVAEERAAWQRFLASEYGDDTGKFNADFGADADDFEAVTLPLDLPPAGDARRAWNEFTALREPPGAGQERRQWQDFLARRYGRIGALNELYRTVWQSFEQVPLFDRVPPDGAPLQDWYQFEKVVKVMHRHAHRFSVLIPSPGPNAELHQLQEQLALARRVVELEKPAHTLFDVGFYWALFRAGEARIGFDTLLGPGSRSPDLLPALVLGRHFVGASHLALSCVRAQDQRMSLDCLPVTA